MAEVSRGRNFKIDPEELRKAVVDCVIPDDVQFAGASDLHEEAINAHSPFPKKRLAERLNISFTVGDVLQQAQKVEKDAINLLKKLQKLIEGQKGCLGTNPFLEFKEALLNQGVSLVEQKKQLLHIPGYVPPNVGTMTAVGTLENLIRTVSLRNAGNIQVSYLQTLIGTGLRMAEAN